MLNVLAAESGVHKIAGADFPLLTALVIVPAIGALLVAITPKRRGDVARLVGVAASAVTAALSVWLVAQFDRANAGFQFTSDHVWIEDLGIHWHLGVDGIFTDRTDVLKDVFTARGIWREPDERGHR